MQSQTQQPQVTPSQAAMQSLMVLASSHPYFKTVEQHEQGWQAIDYLGRYLQEKLKEEQPIPLTTESTLVTE